MVGWRNSWWWCTSSLWSPWGAPEGEASHRWWRLSVHGSLLPAQTKYWDKVKFNQFDFILNQNFYIWNWTHVWLDVNNADLPSVQNFLHSVDAGPVKIPFVLTVLQKPVQTWVLLFWQNILAVLNFRMKYLKLITLMDEVIQSRWKTRFKTEKTATAPVFVDHVVEDLPISEVILSAKLLVSSGSSCGV